MLYRPMACVKAAEVARASAPVTTAPSLSAQQAHTCTLKHSKCMQAGRKAASLHTLIKQFSMAMPGRALGGNMGGLERCPLTSTAISNCCPQQILRSRSLTVKVASLRADLAAGGPVFSAVRSRPDMQARHIVCASPALVEPDEQTEDFLRGPESSLEDEFEEEKGRRSLASIFESDGEEVLEIDATQQDESLLLANCGLSDVTITALNDRGITSLFPIQKHVFEPAAAGRDLIGRARTGSGKTLAFALPVVEKLLAADAAGGRPQRGRAPRCLVLAPTRELAKQVEREFAACAPTLTVGCYYGGSDIGVQIRNLRNGVDVVVGTPGRVIDLIERKLLRLDEVGFAILDEADMMLSVGFAEDVEHILQGVPDERQTLLFSATMPGWVKGLTQRFLKNPILVDLVGDEQSGKIAEGVSVLGLQVSSEARRSILVDVLTVHALGGKSIVFCERKRDADEVAAGVALSMPCEALHGDMSQAGREDVLQRFRDGRLMVLVATDVAARGLDIPNVDLIVHYELPRDADSFLHRSGRTGRAGKTGTAIAMFTPNEAGRFRFIVKSFKIQNLQIIGPPGPREVMAASARQVATRLDNIDPGVKAFFKPAAEAVLANADPHDAMSAALAALSGIMAVPKDRSLLTQQPGYTTVRVVSRPGRITQTAHVFVIVRNLLDSAAADKVGRVRLLPTDDQDQQGAAFDVPHEIADQMFEKVEELKSRGFEMDRPKSLPLADSNRSGGGGGGGGGFRDGRSGGGRSNSYFNGRDSGRSRSGGGGSGGGGGYGSDRGAPRSGRSGYGDRQGGGRGGGGGQGFSRRSYGSGPPSGGGYQDGGYDRGSNGAGYSGGRGGGYQGGNDRY